jgi:hypothetical protein
VNNLLYHETIAAETSEMADRYSGSRFGLDHTELRAASTLSAGSTARTRPAANGALAVSSSAVTGAAAGASAAGTRHPGRGTQE